MAHIGDLELDDCLWRVACAHLDRAESVFEESDEYDAEFESTETRAVGQASYCHGYCSSYKTTVCVPSVVQGTPWQFELEIFDVMAGVGGVLWTGALLTAAWIAAHPDLFIGHRVLELGSGTGLAGMSAARAGTPLRQCLCLLYHVYCLCTLALFGV